MRQLKFRNYLVDNERSLSIAERFGIINYECAIKIEQTIASDAPMLLHKGGVIKQGIHPELDEYRRLAYSGRLFITNSTGESEADNYT